jgi:mono/diheme cytochrome c family protein
LTHGADYLAFVPEVEGNGLAQVTLAAITNVDEAVMYEDIVQPILEAKCYSCHSASKQKGQLRLDGIAMIEKGGKHGPVLVNGVVDSSALYHRLILPVEDSKHMPPEAKPQITSAELDLIHAWVADGYQFNKKVSAYTDKDKIAAFVKAIQSAGMPKQSWVPSTTVAEADPAAIQRLKDLGVLIMPVAQESHYLMANFINARTAVDSTLSLLLPLRKQLLWLNLERAAITDSGMTIVAKLEELRVLSLKDIKIGDTGVERLNALPNLNSLNLVGTAVTNTALKALEKAPKLERMFLFQTTVSAAAIGELIKARAGLHIDTGGYRLPAAATDTLVYKRK